MSNLTHTIENYSSEDKTTDTTEYKFSDGTRFVKVNKNGRNTVFVAEFEGDEEKRSTAKALAEKLETSEELKANGRPAKASPETMAKKQARLESLKARLTAATERRVAREETAANATETTLALKIAAVEKFIKANS